MPRFRKTRLSESSKYLYHRNEGGSTLWNDFHEKPYGNYENGPCIVEGVDPQFNPYGAIRWKNPRRRKDLPKSFLSTSPIAPETSQTHDTRIITVGSNLSRYNEIDEELCTLDPSVLKARRFSSTSCPAAITVDGWCDSSSPEYCHSCHRDLSQRDNPRRLFSQENEDHSLRAGAKILLDLIHTRGRQKSDFNEVQAPAYPNTTPPIARTTSKDSLLDAQVAYRLQSSGGHIIVLSDGCVCCPYQDPPGHRFDEDGDYVAFERDFFTANASSIEYSSENSGNSTIFTPSGSETSIEEQYSGERGSSDFSNL